MKDLQKRIKAVTNTQINNQAQKDMREKFGLFVTYFLFWLPKYDKWYDKRVKEIRDKLQEVIE